MNARAWGLAAALSLASASAYAAGEATTLQLVVKKIQLQNIAGDWITAAEPNEEILYSAEEPVYQFKNKGSVPPGEYRNVRVVFGETIKFAGRDADSYTREGGKLVIGGSARTASELPCELTRFDLQSLTWSASGPAGLMTETLEFDFGDRDDVMEIRATRDLPKKVKVKEGSVIKVYVGLDLKKSVTYTWKNYFPVLANDDAMMFVPPSIVAELSISVDGITALATNETIIWEF